MELEGKIINFLGDSITEGHGVTYPDNIYTARMGRMCSFKRVNNYGIGGTRYARQIKPTVGNEKFDQDFCMRSTQMDKDADIVVVMGGTNDFGHGDAPIGVPTDRTPDTFWGACHYLMSTLITTYPNAAIVICTPIHRLNEDVPTGDNKPEPVGTLRDYVNIIRSVAEYYALPVCDLYATSGLQPRFDNVCKRLVPDGLHPNDAGHLRLAERLTAFLKAL